MAAAIIALITAIVGYFASKKAGASDSQAALVGAAAGVGTYYVGTNTEWGKNAVSKITSWVTPSHNGSPLEDSSGNPARIPNGAEVILDDTGEPVRNPDGSIAWKLVDAAGNVLTSWGPTGTAGVIGAAGLLGTIKSNPLPWIVGAVAVIAILR